MKKVLAQEIIAVRQNKILIEYLHDTSQLVRLNPVSGEIEFLENRVMTTNWNEDKSWGGLVKPIIQQHPAQHRNLSALG